MFVKMSETAKYVKMCFKLAKCALFIGILSYKKRTFNSVKSAVLTHIKCTIYAHEWQ